MAIPNLIGVYILANIVKKEYLSKHDYSQKLHELMSKNNNIQEPLLSFINALKGFMDQEEGMCLNKYASKSSESWSNS